MPYTFLESGSGFNSGLFRYARTLVRAAAERAKPNEDRLARVHGLRPAADRAAAQCGGSGLSGAREADPRPSGSMRMREFLGPDYPLVSNLLSRISPEALAESLRVKL